MKYDVQMVATIRTYRVVRVEADSPEAAKARAKKLIRSVGTIRDDEEVGDWCDEDAPTRPRVRHVFPAK